MSFWGLFRRRPAIERTPPPPAPSPPPVQLPFTQAALAEMTPIARRRAVLSAVIVPTLAWMVVRGVGAEERAKVVMLAIGGQESEFLARRQYGNGPARGFWQFERGGGVAGVLSHKSSMALAAEVCRWREVEPSASAVHLALVEDDLLAAAFARLLLFTDPKPLPADEEAAFAYYLRNWRPGAWYREAEDSPARAKLRAKWKQNWALAQAAVTPVVEGGRK